jgi:hypothetical protein
MSSMSEPDRCEFQMTESNETTLRRTVRDALVEAGRPGEGSLASQMQASTFEEIAVPLRQGWQVLRFNVIPHATASFHVAVGQGRVVYLTGEPQSFTDVLRASDGIPRSTAEAVALARAYLDTTQPMTEFFRVLDSVDDLIIRGRHGDDDVIAILRETITPPVGGLTFETYQVIAHVQRGDTVERSTVSIAPNGSLVEQCRILATGLPIPYLV